MKRCSICEHSSRAEIENALMMLGTSEAQTTIEAIAEKFEVDLVELKAHAMFHAPLSGTPNMEISSPRDSLMRKAKIREVDLLSVVANEYLITLKAMGRRINRLANVSSLEEEDIEKQVQLTKMLSKPMVDLYIGVGTEIRQTVKTMAELERLLNGPEDSAAEGLKALATAITGSRNIDD